MRSLTFYAVLASVTLVAAPLAAQDTTSAKKDTTAAKKDSAAARPDTGAARKDTTGVRKDTAVVAPVQDTTGVRKDTAAVTPPVQDTTGVRKDTAVVAPPVQDTTGVRNDTAAAAPVPAAPPPEPQPAPDTAAAAPPSQDNAVRPGMSEAEVRARWGEPLATRTANDWTYLFYRNRRERRVGYDDVVFLQHGQVMDAIVRSPEHVYAGESSSPEGRMPVFTPPQHPADTTRGAAVTGVRVKPSP